MNFCLSALYPLQFDECCSPFWAPGAPSRPPYESLTPRRVPRHGCLDLAVWFCFSCPDPVSAFVLALLGRLGAPARNFSFHRCTYWVWLHYSVAGEVGSGEEGGVCGTPGLILIDVVCCDMNSLTMSDCRNGRWPGSRLYCLGINSFAMLGSHRLMV